MKLAAVILSSLPMAYGLGGVSFYADNKVMYLCGDHLNESNMCPPPGPVDQYVHLEEEGEMCEALFQAEGEGDDVIYSTPAPRVVGDITLPAGTIASYTEYTGNNGWRCEGKNDHCEKCTLKGPAGKSGGDPHFETYDGTQYSYHGECDLVMARSKSFANGLGLDLHIRTKGMGSWSLIESAVVRIGDDTFEMKNDGTHYINGKTNQPIPKKLAGRFQTTKERIIKEKQMPDGTTQTIDKTIAIVHLDGGNEVRFTRLDKGIMYVKIDAHLHGTEGMLGSYTKPGLVGRDGVLLTSADDMGVWQVNGTEPMLFREARAPQWPEKCIAPAQNAQQRRLRTSDKEIKMAQQVCDKVEDGERTFCVEDVLLTGDPASANAYIFGEAF